jgi:hypothetical protein
VTPWAGLRHAALAAQIQALLGGVLSLSATGHGIRITLSRVALDTPGGYIGRRNVVIRLMDSGGLRRDYWRFDVEGKAGVSAAGGFTHDASMTHHAIGPTTFNDIVAVFDVMTGGWR